MEYGASQQTPHSSGFTDMRRSPSFSCCSILFFALLAVSNGGDTITQSQTIDDGQTLVSSGGIFELGFFSPGSSRQRYLGIWFAVSKEVVVWVANRDRPLAASAGVLTIDGSGNLVVTGKANGVIWSSGLSKAGNTVARLLDSGNFVLTAANGGNPSVLWQSFDHPSDTLLAGMKLGPDFRTGSDRILTAWKSSSDPAAGNFVGKLDPHGLPQLRLWDQGSVTYRSGPWNGVRFSGIPEMKSYDMLNFTVVSTQDEAYYQYGIAKPRMSGRLVLNPSGVVQRFVLNNMSWWNIFWYAPKDQCDKYGFCGPYGVCDINKSPLCNCLPGFQPRYPDKWYMRDGSGGCVRKTKLNCSSTGDGFLLVPQVKLPDTANATVNTSMSLGECREACLRSCSCTAYSSANILRGESGCVMWRGNLTDMRAFVSDGQDLYLPLAASEIDSILERSPNGRKVKIVVIVVVVLGVLLFGSCAYYLCRKKKRMSARKEVGIGQHYSDRSTHREDPDVPLFDFDTIASATNNFSNENIIGEGGFGIVYKGNLDDGQEVAVKRLSFYSAHGVDGFKNEVTLIAKLQHRNLVRLLGCCIGGDEWMLIYEYMPNKSLDAFIFDDRKRHLLDWRKRLDIILGVARGLLYLHQDSRLRIIHRDLKAGNILLDGEMNPKISDFGTARIFGGDQIEVTRRVVGTYGYMSPEYAMDGVFSVKTDVFSFGVLALEIISGRKNRWISQIDSNLNFPAHAWKLWKEDHCLELLDNALSCQCPLSEVLRCIQVALLCVQGSPSDRPTMQQVVLMLVNENSILPQPKQPGFFTVRDPKEVDSSSSSQHNSSSTNKLTMTNLEGR